MTRVATSLAEGSTEQVGETLVADLRIGLADQAPALVMAFASPVHPLAGVLSGLHAAFPGALVIGATTAGEFTEKGDAKQAVAAVALAGPYRAFAGMGRGLRASPERAVEEAVSGLPRSVVGYPHRTAILLLDPMAGNGEETTLLTASMLGDDVRLVGGAAGDDLHMMAPEVGLGGAAAADAAVVAVLFSRAPLGIGVCHDHQPISAPHKVTRAEANLVIEIDGRPAWDVWVEATREHAAARGLDVTKMADDEIGAFLLLFEAGLSVGREYKIRAPLSREGTAIRFATALPEGTVLRITESTPERQIASAREAARRACAQLRNRPAGAVVFDCICRNLILKDRFRGAVAEMSEELGGAPLAGFETYGEIALDTGNLSGFHNTTSVVLAFPEE